MNSKNVLSKFRKDMHLKQNGKFVDVAIKNILLLTLYVIYVIIENFH